MFSRHTTASITLLLAALACGTIPCPAPAQPANTFAAWAAQPGVPEDQQKPLDTPAGDGVANLMKFALGVAPLENAADHLPTPELATLSETTVTPALRYTRNPSAEGIRYGLEVSMDLATWDDTVATLEILEDLADGRQSVRLRETVPPIAAARFARLKVYVAPTGFVLIPAGTFTMGDSTGDTAEGSNQIPLPSVTLPAFFLARTPTTWAEWQSVREWALDHGYDDLAGSGSGKAPTHPVQTVSWYSALKWCNARSEREGLTPCYYTDDARTVVYRTGGVDVTNAQVDWNANGYRLPTEAEWEYAARGGHYGRRFPWGDIITHARSNYSSRPDRAIYDKSTTTGYHPTYFDNLPPYTSPVGSFPPNDFGLYDIVGNVAQICWDRSGGYGPEPVTSPRGPDTGTQRIIRGGSWGARAFFQRLAYRVDATPGYSVFSVGFRCARNAAP